MKGKREEGESVKSGLVLWTDDAPWEESEEECVVKWLTSGKEGVEPSSLVRQCAKAPAKAAYEFLPLL